MGVLYYEVRNTIYGLIYSKKGTKNCDFYLK
jgi:hypothetical protein